MPKTPSPRSGKSGSGKPATDPRAKAMAPQKPKSSRTGPIKVPKRPTNLTLDPEAVVRGEKFGERHSMSLSKLVSEFLYALPDALSSSVAECSPPVERLRGLGLNAKADRVEYRDHLADKYGGK